MHSEENRPPLEEVPLQPDAGRPVSPVALPLLLIAGAVVFALVSVGGFLAVPRLLDRGDPSRPAPQAAAR